MSGTPVFSGRAVGLMVAIGVAAFFAFLVGMAFAPESAGEGDAGAHGASPSAVGYCGLGQLIERMGGNVELSRHEEPRLPERLLILTPPSWTDAEELKELARGYAERSGPVLVILPKHQTMPQEERPGWVWSGGLLAPAVAAAKLKPLGDIGVQRIDTPAGRPTPRTSGNGIAAPMPMPRQLQVLEGGALEPLIETEAGDVILARLEDSRVHLLADPDLMNNAGLADRRHARAAIDIVDALTPGANRAVTFDLTLNGFGASRSALQAVFEPPLLGALIAALAAAALAGLRAATRFGPVRRLERPYAFGRRSLLDNSAALIRQARSEEASAAAYIDVVRRRAAQRAGLPENAPREQLDRELDRFGAAGGATFSGLAGNLYRAETPQAISRAARALHEWKESIA